MREGLIPTILGTAVTATGIALGTSDMKRHSLRQDSKVLLGVGVLGFGLAHVVLGTIDLARNSRDRD